MILILILKTKFQKILILILNENLILSHVWFTLVSAATAVVEFVAKRLNLYPRTVPDSQSDSCILKYVLFAQDPDTEERKQMFLDSIQRIEQFQRDNQVRPPSLKVDSAIAICKKFKDLVEILSLGPSATIRWRGICHQDCESNGNIYIL